MNKKFIFWLTVTIVIIVIIIVFLRMDEDTWIKDANGMWVKHGIPNNVSEYISEQQNAVIGAMQLYQQKKSEGMQFNSQCLGTVGNDVKYAVDIIHVPRSDLDNLRENQCADFLNGNVEHFIELDYLGNIVRIV